MQHQRSSDYRKSSDGTVVTASTASTSNTRSTFGSIDSSDFSTCSTDSKKKLVRWKDLTSNKTNHSNSSGTRVDVRFDRISLSECLKSSRDIDHHPDELGRGSGHGGSGSSSSRRSSITSCSSDSKLLPAKRLKELQRQMASLEGKIQKAARVELAYLNEAKQVKDKRDEWKKLCHSLQEKLRHRLKAGIPFAQEEDMKQQIERVETKIKKAVRMENTYMKKSKEIRDRRYRWTQLYEVNNREYQQLSQQYSKASSSSSSARRSKELPPLLPNRRRVLNMSD